MVQIADNAWHHLALVFRSGYGLLYLDGTLVKVGKPVRS